MKKLLLIFFIPLFINCNNESTKKHTSNITFKKWYSTGAINPNNKNEFIVNDSISIMAAKSNCGIRYSIFKNGKQVVVTPVYTYKATHNSAEEVINCLEGRYLVKGTEKEYDSPFSFKK